MLTRHNKYYINRKNLLLDLLGALCVNCGTDNNLQFDHINPEDKSFTITGKLCYTLEKILPELQKCQLLCKDCHLVKTREEGSITGCPKTYKYNHGTANMYNNYNCRCLHCKKAWTGYINMRREWAI